MIYKFVSVQSQICTLISFSNRVKNNNAASFSHLYSDSCCGTIKFGSVLFLLDHMKFSPVISIHNIVPELLFFKLKYE
jgi:hypothetical protein